MENDVGVEAKFFRTGESELTDRFRVGNWLVTAAWERSHDKAAAPSRLTIESAEAEIEARGVTTSVLREVETELVRHIAELRESDVAKVMASASDQLTGAIARAKESDRIDGDYYAAIADAVEALRQQGQSRPVKVLAAALDLPIETLRTQLKKARKLGAN